MERNDRERIKSPTKDKYNAVGTLLVCGSVEICLSTPRPFVFYWAIIVVRGGWKQMGI